MPEYTELRRMMVDTQIRPSDVTKFPIIDAMLSVPREHFVPQNMRHVAYAEDPVSLGEGREMLEPRTLAKMLDALEINRTDLSLNVGAGLGYSTAILSHMVDSVVAIEENEGFAADAEASLGEQGMDNAAVLVETLVDGAKKHGPYDVILVDGGVNFVPDQLLEQLNDGGRIAAVFLDGQLGEARLGLKVDGQVSWRRLFNAGAPLLPGFASEKSFAL